MDKVLSVSVACYNLKEMIEDNIKSFCESDVRDKIELIIVDDGSKDNTLEFVKKWVDKYPDTIKLIAKENGGPGSTVNCGIKHATGKYFRMLDGDDMAMTKNLDRFIHMLENTDSDMIISNYCCLNNQTKKTTLAEKCDLEEGVIKGFDEVYKKLPFEMHTITYKTSILRDNNITLDNCFYTDTQYVLYPIPFVNTVTYFNDIIYVYRVGSENQSVSVSSMIKNRAQHEFVLFNNVKYYERYKNNLTKAKRYYICKRLGHMARTQTKILLNLPRSKESKNELKVFFKKLKKESKDVYKIALESKKIKLLIMSGFLCYSFLSKHTQKKGKIIKT